MKFPSASRLSRAFKCSASAVLPRIDEESTAGTKGTVLHKFLESVALAKSQEMVDLLVSGVPEEHRTICDALARNRRFLPIGSGWIPEACYVVEAFSGETRRVDNIEAERAGSEIFVKADAVRVEGSFGWVIDYKTGRQEGVELAAESWQLRIAAMALAGFHGVGIVHVAHVFIDGEGFARWSAATFTKDQLEGFQNELRVLAGRIMDARKAPENYLAVGRWCAYCPSFRVCPAQVTLAKSMALAPAEAVGDAGVITWTPEIATAVYRRVRDVEEVLKRVKSSLYLWAQENPIELDGGLVYGPVEIRREELDGLATRDSVIEHLGPEYVDDAVELSATKASVERAARKAIVSKGGTISGLKNAVLEGVRVRGGVEVKTRTEVREKRRA